MKTIVALIIALTTFSARAQEASENIRLNQVGFYPDAPKIAVIVDAPSDMFVITTTSFSDTVYVGALQAEQKWSLSGENVRKANFTDLADEGEYVLHVPELGHSYPFEIKPFVHQRVAMWSLKGFYFQRASMPLEKEFAGKWARKAGHPDTVIYVHASAATKQRPENTIISCPRGWYDAGDFNKYIVNSGISTFTLLQLYENYPEYCQSLKTYIPESGNALPDILDETLWNIRWMLTMQDPNDGGVYHKCTHANFQGFIMPHRATAKRYVVQKSTHAALDFAAVMATAARVYAPFEPQMPGFADSCLAAALAAWRWARANPDSSYKQSRINANYTPAINTGEYGGGGASDEFDWAASELFVTTKADSFLQASDPFDESDTRLPSWGQVRTLGYYSLLQHEKSLPDVYDKAGLRARILNWVDDLISHTETSPYNVIMGRTSSDFVWGSNAVAANQAIAALMAYKIDPQPKYFNAALHNLDYLLGRNATGYCFLTGFGKKPPMHIHHRQSGADGVRDPVPGLLAGGPNKGQQDKSNSVKYASDLPAKSYTDVQGSYASNEIAINWNAAFVYTACAIEAIYSQDGTAGATQVKKAKPGPATFKLHPAYPNPFNSATTITFELVFDENILLAIFNLLGEKVTTLYAGQLKSGQHRFAWQAADIASGVYLCRLQTEHATQQTKLLYLR